MQESEKKPTVNAIKTKLLPSCMRFLLNVISCTEHHEYFFVELSICRFIDNSDKKSVSQVYEAFAHRPTYAFLQTIVYETTGLLMRFYEAIDDQTYGRLQICKNIDPFNAPLSWSIYFDPLPDEIIDGIKSCKFMAAMRCFLSIIWNTGKFTQIVVPLREYEKQVYRALTHTQTSELIQSILFEASALKIRLITDKYGLEISQVRPVTQLPLWNLVHQITCNEGLPVQCFPVQDSPAQDQSSPAQAQSSPAQSLPISWCTVQ